MTFGRLVLTWALKDRKGAKETERRLPSQLSKEFEDLGLPLKPSETWGSKSSRIYFKRVGGFICPLCPWLWSEREESNRTPTTLPDLGASLSSAWWSTHPWRWKSLWIVRHRSRVGCRCSQPAIRKPPVGDIHPGNLSFLLKEHDLHMDWSLRGVTWLLVCIRWCFLASY